MKTNSRSSPIINGLEVFTRRLIMKFSRNLCVHRDWKGFKKADSRKFANLFISERRRNERRGF
jgi:hypothetical protein